MSKITPSQFDEQRSSEAAPFVLDIRPREEFTDEHIEDSHNVPVYADLQNGDERAFRNALGEVPSDRPVVVVCKAGIVARRATSILNEEGYDARTLLGGMGAWRGYRNETLGYKLRSLVWKLTA